MNTYTLKQRTSWMLKKSQTSMVRFWFAFYSFFFALFIALSPIVESPHSEYTYAMMFVPCWTWVILFMVHAFSLWYGVFTRKYNHLLYWLEAVNGCAIWTAMGIATWIVQGAPGGATAGALLAAWLQYRYPEFWERTDEL